LVAQKTTVVNPNGFHIRATNVFTHKMQQFESAIQVLVNGKEFDGKSYMSMLLSAIRGGQEITIQCEGPDETEALDSALQVIADGLGDKL